MTPRKVPTSESVRPVQASEAQVPRPPHLTLRTYALAAAAMRIVGNRDTVEDAPEARFLLSQLAVVSPGGEPWAASLPSYLRNPSEVDAPLLQLARDLPLTTLEILTVSLAAGVEEDLMVGRTVAYLQAPVGGSRPTLGFITSMFANPAEGVARPLEVLVSGNAMKSGLLTFADERPPLAERPLAVPVPLYLALVTRSVAWPGATIGVDPTQDVPLPPSTLTAARRHAAALGGGRALVIRTPSVREGRAVAAQIAAARGCRPLFIEQEYLHGLGPLLHLTGFLPVFCCALAPGERRILPSLPYYRGPNLAVCGPDGAVESDQEAPLTWKLDVPPREERRQLWQQALGNASLADALAQYHRHGTGRIAHLGRLAHHQSALEGKSQPDSDDVLMVSWSSESVDLSALAEPLPEPIPDEALVLPAMVRADLELLLERCRMRDGLAEGLGVSVTSRYRTGVRALLVGPSGTGKTLAAGWLATKLSIPLYRVDLSAVVSKYIGETEKNLGQLLAQAEQAEIMLLFDEADSLFGKRTDVKDSNDRFANSQTNYLLQRIESFDGIALLTSNSRNRFDASFTRRLDAITEFSLPGPEERRALWLSHLGQNHRLLPKEINLIAGTADVGGGYIRNAVLSAAVLAHHRSHPIEYEDVVDGLAIEYRKLGRQLDASIAAGARSGLS